MASEVQAHMVRLTPLQELYAIFAGDKPPDSSRFRRLAIIITLQMADRAAAASLHQDLEAAISLFEDDPEAGRMSLAFLAPELEAASRRH